MSTSAPALLGSRRPRVCSHPPYGQTYGPEAVELAASAGLIADPWQADIMNTMLAVTPAGMWVCPECGFVVPRQNGKGSIFEMRALAGLYLLGEPLLMWSAHEYKTAMEGFRRILDLIENTDDLRKRVFKVSNTNGDEGVELHGEGPRRITGRQRLRFLARSKGSGRGFTGWVNLLDEWFAGTQAQVEALLPTMSAVANPQTVYASTPPLDSATGEPLFSLRKRGETGTDPGLAWFDWGAPADVDPDDQDEWARSNPALGIRVRIEAVAQERRSMSVDGFLRERLGVWPKAPGQQWRVIPEPAWSGQVDHDPQRPADIALAVQVDYRRGHTAIVACGPRDNGSLLASVVEYRSGTDWVIDRLAELRTKWRPVVVVVQDKGPTGSLIDAMEKADIPVAADRERPNRGDIVSPWSDDVADAYGWVVDAIGQGRFWHLDEAPLTKAVADANTRNLSGALAWDYKGETDCSPLLAATFAHWGYVKFADVVADAFEPSALWI